MAGRPKRGEPSLTQERIVDEAWALVDREGLGGLSTRKPAEQLGVQSPALYWHVKNKRQLLGLMVERILENSIMALSDGLEWWEWMREAGKEQHRTLLAHRDGGMIAAINLPSGRLRSEVFTKAIERLEAAGFTRESAAAAWGGLASMVLGSVIYEQNLDTKDFAAAFGDPAQTFDYALETYIGGLRRRSAAQET